VGKTRKNCRCERKGKRNKEISGEKGKIHARSEKLIQNGWSKD
jgi:hypothetical protein